MLTDYSHKIRAELIHNKIVAFWVKHKCDGKINQFPPASKFLAHSGKNWYSTKDS